MTDIPFFIIFTKANKHKIKTFTITNTGTDLINVHNKLINIIQEEFSKFKEFPESYDAFISKEWYRYMSADADPFEYKIFMDGSWLSPWTTEELYDKVVEILHKLEVFNALVIEANKNEDEFDEDNDVDEEIIK